MMLAYCLRMAGCNMTKFNAVDSCTFGDSETFGLKPACLARLRMYPSPGLWVTLAGPSAIREHGGPRQTARGEWRL